MTDWQLIDTTYPDDDPAHLELQRALKDNERKNVDFGDDAYLLPMGRFEWALHDLYHSTVDALTEPMPADVDNTSQLSVLMLTRWNLPVLGKLLGERVHAWREQAHDAAVERLHEVLVSIESEMK